MINQKTLISEKKVNKRKSYSVLQDPSLTNFALKECAQAVTNTSFELAVE